MRRTRILIADSLPIFRSGVRNLLARESDFEVVESSTFDELVREVATDCPDIALVDLELPPRGGVTAVSYLAERCSAHTIVWSFEPSRETVLRAIRAGASGYLHKEISPPGLVRSLRGVVRGEAPLARDLASLMIEALHGCLAGEGAIITAEGNRAFGLPGGGLRLTQLGLATQSLDRLVEDRLHVLSVRRPARIAQAGHESQRQHRAEK